MKLPPPPFLYRILLLMSTQLAEIPVLKGEFSLCLSVMPYILHSCHILHPFFDCLGGGNHILHR